MSQAEQLSLEAAQNDGPSRNFFQFHTADNSRIWPVWLSALLYVKFCTFVFGFKHFLLLGSRILRESAAFGVKSAMR